MTTGKGLRVRIGYELMKSVFPHIPIPRDSQGVALLFPSFHRVIQNMFNIKYFGLFIYFDFRMYAYWDRSMAQSVQCLLHKHKDLSSDPQKTGGVACL